MSIVCINRSLKKAWDDYVLNHPAGIAYHLYAWKEAVERAYGFKGYYLAAMKHNNIMGVLPLIHLKKPLLKGSLVALPYCDAGGPIADSPQIEKILILDALRLSVQLNTREVVVRSCRPMGEIKPEQTLNNEKVRMLLQLPSDSDTLLASLKAKVRSQVKKPIRDGLVVVSGGMELFDEFYPLFCRNMRDLGSPVHSSTWLKSVLRAYKNRSQLFLVRMPDGAPAAGGILLCHPKVVSVPWASSLRQYNRWNPNMLLYWGFLKFSSDNGYPVFDFGRSTPGAGTFRFKRQWGAVPAPLHWADFDTAGNHCNGLVPAAGRDKNSYSKNRIRQLVGNVVKETPVSFTNVLGTLTRKYISL